MFASPPALWRMQLHSASASVVAALQNAPMLAGVTAHETGTVNRSWLTVPGSV
jgi:hypothetical protein